MLEKTQYIRNPLTIVAIFATLTEVSGTGVLPFIDHPNQITFIYFLIFFPIFLVVIFFLTLNFNYKVLYAPSDFRNERFFIDLIRPALPSEIHEKIESETKELQADLLDTIEIPAETEITGTDKTEEKTIPREQKNIPEIDDINSKDNRSSRLKNRLIIGEKLALDQIGLEENVIISRDVRLQDTSGKSFVFDGSFGKNGIIVLIEVKFLANTRNIMDRVLFELRKLESITLRNELLKTISVMLVLIFDDSKKYPEAARRNFEKISERSQIPIRIRTFSLPELEAAAGRFDA
jgi:hypothetical protein